MLSPSMMTRSKRKVSCSLAICSATSYCARSPVPLSPKARNLSDPGALGKGVACARTAADVRAASTADANSRRRAGSMTITCDTIHWRAPGRSRSVGKVSSMVKRRRIRGGLRVAGVVAAVWLAGVWPAAGQEASEAQDAEEPASRAEADREKREAKSQDTHPYQPGRFERAMRLAEDRGLFVLGREGFYPKLGSLTTGSGFAIGGGYRDRDLFDKKGVIDVWIAASLRKYWATEVRLTFPRIANRRMLVETWAAHRDYPQEDFFGLGPDSARDAQTSYAITSDRIGARAGVRPFPIMLVGGGTEYLNPRLGPGKDSSVSSIEEVF